MLNRIIAMGAAGAALCGAALAEETKPQPIDRPLPANEEIDRCLGSGGNTDRTSLVKVKLAFDVMPNGRTANVIALDSPDPCFSRAAVRAISQWRYDPATKDGAAVTERDMTTTLQFDVLPPIEDQLGLNEFGLPPLDDDQD